MAFEITLTTPLFSGPVQASNYSYNEESSPLSGGDSSGSTGTFSVTIPIPAPDAPDATRHPLWSYHRDLGDGILHDATVGIFDSRKGLTTGTVKLVERSKDGGSIQLSGTTRLALMNIFNIQAQPFSGSLNAAITYYLGLAGITTGFTVDASIATTPVVVPGWYGELWLRVKQLVSAYGCDISLVSNIIQVRPLRERVASSGRDTSRSTSIGGYGLAQAVEVYQYNNRPIVDQPVYPPQPPALEDQILNVNAGENAYYTLTLSSSLSSIQTPLQTTFMDLPTVGSSAYVITANNGDVISPTEWEQSGGSVKVTIAPSTTELEVSLFGPRALYDAAGEVRSSYSLSVNDPVTGNRYSTLRIVGTGVAFTREKKRIRTGVPASMAGTDVGVTIDNPNVSTANDVARVGLRAARQYAGTQMSLSGSVISVNRRGDSGQVVLPTYGQVQDALVAAIGGTPTYAQVQAYYTSLGLLTWGQIQEYWEAYFADPDIDQVFGNVQGARIWDRGTRRWYRIRSASLTPGGIAFSDAEDDLTYADYQEHHAGKTYAQVQAELSGYTYRQVEMIGMI